MLSAVAALLHLAVIAGGPEWYRFFGAGEAMARAAAAGSLRPTLITIGIASILAIWSAYALAGAGVLPRLPLTRLALAAITLVYLTRGLIVVPVLLVGYPPATPFNIWSSVIVLGYGVVHAIGLSHAWTRLGAPA